jgi:zinc protease
MLKDSKLLAATLMVTALVLSLPVVAQEATDVASWAKDPDAPMPVDPLITVGILDNGLTYYIRRNPEPENRASLWLVVNAGSNQEDDDQQGLAHFVEHMAFNGTQNYPRQKLIDYLESTGMRFGPDINAYTSFDETVYMLTVPTDKDGLVETGIDILREWAGGIAFAEEEVDKERGVVVEEWRLGLGAESRIRDQTLPVLFKDSRYAERLPIGKKEILEKAPYEAFHRFYRDWYRPDLMAVIAVGDIDAEAIEELIVNNFGDLENPTDPRPREVYPVPDHEETLFGIATDPEAPATILQVYYKLPRQPEDSANAYRRSILERLYSDMINARLDEVSRQPNPPFLFAASGQDNRFVRSREVYYQLAAVQEDEVERGLEALLTEVERVDRHGFTETELERSKKDYLRAVERIYEERDNIDSSTYNAEYTRVFLWGEPTPGIAMELDMVRAFLPTITVEELNSLAREWISDRNRVVLLAAPDKYAATLPDGEEILTTFGVIAEREIEPYVDEVTDDPLLAELPEPGRVIIERRNDAVGVVDWRLSNGVRVLLKPTDFREDQVLLTGFSPGGHSLVPDEQYVSAMLATTLLEEGGLGEFDVVTLEKMLAGKAVQASAYINELEEGVSAGASPKDLETMFQLVYLAFTSPRKDVTAYQTFIGRMAGFIENREARPENVFQDKLSGVLTQDHFRRRPPSEAFLQEVDLDDAYEIYLDRFADASDFTFIMVGTFDPDEVKPLVTRYLGGLPSIRRDETWADVGVESPEGIEQFEVTRGREPKSQVRLVFTGDADFSRDAVHEMRSLSTVLSIRLREILREDLGGTYGVGVSGGVNARPSEGYAITISFGCAPENAEDLIAAVFAEIDRVKREGVEDSYIEKVREQQYRQRETDIKENGFWIGALKNYLIQGWELEQILELDELVEQLSSERIREAANRYFNEERYVLGVLYPEDWETAVPATEAPVADGR